LARLLGTVSSSVQKSFGAFESIATSVTTGTGVITFSSIPSTYQHLQIRITGFGNNNSSYGRGEVRFNGDTGTNYAWHRFGGDGQNVMINDGAASQTSMKLIGRNWGFNSTTAMVAIIDIHDYASTTKNKTTRSFNGHDGNAVGQSDINLATGLWMSTAAVSSITILLDAGLYGTGTNIALYGIKGA
jgi:hypothetical protein